MPTGSGRIPLGACGSWLALRLSGRCESPKHDRGNRPCQIIGSVEQLSILMASPTVDALRQYLK